MASRLLEFSKSIDKRLWFDLSPLRQFTDLSGDLIRKLEDADLAYVCIKPSRRVLSIR